MAQCLQHQREADGRASGCGSVLFSDSVIESLDPARIDRTSARELSREFQASLDALSDGPAYAESKSMLPERRDVLFQGVRKVGGSAGSGGDSMTPMGPSDEELKELWESFASGMARSESESSAADASAAGRPRSALDYMAHVVPSIPVESFSATSQALLANAFTKCLRVRRPVHLSMSQSMSMFG